jgi:hypothetical protein
LLLLLLLCMKVSDYCHRSCLVVHFLCCDSSFYRQDVRSFNPASFVQEYSGLFRSMATHVSKTDSKAREWEILLWEKISRASEQWSGNASVVPGSFKNEKVKNGMTVNDCMIHRKSIQ